MEAIITTISILIFGLMILSPILILVRLKRRNKNKVTIKYFLIGLFLMALLTSIFTAWGEISNLILLNHYGYSVDGMNYENVLPENRVRVDELVTSIMGIGWPLKTILGFVMTIPYLIIVYFGKILIDKMKK